MLVTMAGTMTMASAREGCMVTASRPIDTVGRPSPIARLTKPASRNEAAMRIRRGSNMKVRLTDRGYRHNLQVTERAFGNNEGRETAHHLILRSGHSAASRRMRTSASWFETAQGRLLTMRDMEIAMRFDLVDLQLFIAVPEARTSTGGALRPHLALASASARIKGLEAALGTALLKRGRRGVEPTASGESLLDHARIIIHNVEAMRGDLAAYASGAKASVHLLANTSGLSEHLPKALAVFLREHPDISVDVEERESADIAAAIATGAADLGFAAEHALPDNIERFLFSEDRLVLVAARRGEFASRRQIDFQEVTARDFVGLTNSTALQIHIAKHAALLRARLRFRAGLRDFDAICQIG